MHTMILYIHYFLLSRENYIDINFLYFYNWLYYSIAYKIQGEFKMISTAKRLINTISNSTSPFHTTIEAKKQLNDAGFEELLWDSDWNILTGHNYYIAPFDTTLFAFKINENFNKNDILKIATAHIDSPGLRIKANPEHFQDSYMKVNTEIYGGAILNTWLDRPLSIAGRVFLKGDTHSTPKMELIDFINPLLMIPNLSIHLNHSVNDGIALNNQIDMIPIAGITSNKETDHHFITDLIAKKLNVASDEILSYELCVYNCEKGCIAGINDEFIMAPRIDNISSVQACLTGIIESESTNGIDLIALFDHEEIGSRSKNGAAGNLLPFVLERIYNKLGVGREDYLKSIVKGFFLSLDVAHATNPNHPEKYDITSKIQINDGIALKSTSKQSYCSDGQTAAILLSLSKEHDIPLVVNYLRSDSPGGCTLGSILFSVLPMKCADLGVPIFAMHSAMETMGITDQYNLEKFIKAFFTSL